MTPCTFVHMLTGKAPDAAEGDGTADSRRLLEEWIAGSTDDPDINAALRFFAECIDALQQTTDDEQQTRSRAERVMTVRAVAGKIFNQSGLQVSKSRHEKEPCYLALQIPEDVFKRLRFIIKEKKLDPQIIRGIIRGLQYDVETYNGTNVFIHDGGDRFITRLFQLMASPPPENQRTEHMVQYVPTSVQEIPQIVDGLALSEDDTLVDLGCGLGRFLLTAHVLTKARCIGIEQDPAYARFLSERIEMLGLSRVSVVNADASSEDTSFDEGTAFYLYRPFTGPMFDAVIDKIRRVAQRNQVRVCTKYMSGYPLDSSWFRRIDKLTCVQNHLQFFESR